MQTKYIAYSSTRPPRLLRKTVATVMTIALAGVALMFSAVILTVLLIMVVIGGSIFWWKTRELRKQMKQQMQNVPSPSDATKQSDIFADTELKGQVIEGESVRVDEAVFKVKR
jgi:ABC-type transport system involved in cytochrome bd biosynthesis fused ATPase/permease subunit